MKREYVMSVTLDDSTLTEALELVDQAKELLHRALLHLGHYVDGSVKLKESDRAVSDG